MIGRQKVEYHIAAQLKVTKAADKWEQIRGRFLVGDATLDQLHRHTEVLARAVRRMRRFA
jgi:hypothetical protein